MHTIIKIMKIYLSSDRPNIVNKQYHSYDSFKREISSAGFEFKRLAKKNLGISIRLFHL